MQKISNMCIADYYGEYPINIPKEIFQELRRIIKLLYENNVENPDITGYNFIKQSNKVWIIDFGDEIYNPYIDTKGISDKFINKFINGYNGWNPNFI